MHLCDLTLAYTETSGGIRTYIDQKRRFLAEETDHRHTLIIAGKGDSVKRDGPLTVITVDSPVIPGCEPYRFFWRPDKLRAALEETQPDAVELGSFFISPWSAFRYRSERRAADKPCVVGAYFHTDLADAYFAHPIEEATDEILSWSDTLHRWGTKLSDVIGNRMENHFGGIFQRCDLTFAATPAQARRLHHYGVGGTEIIPLGVDTRLFHPSKRSDKMRQEAFGAGENDIVLIYAGRLDVEKDVDLLADAFEALNLPNAKLVMMGEGPRREDLEERAERVHGMQIRHYEKDKPTYAALLASADIYVTAGPHETFGLSVVEAQACGLPVVGVKAGALTERVVDGTGRLVPEGDAEAFARAVEQIAPDRKTCGEAARRHIDEGGYGWDSSFRKLVDCYERALEREAIPGS
ncbi:MAG: glycosyltransferase [Opitutales bacterium]